MIGRLKHRLALLNAVRVADGGGGGGSSISYSPDVTVWAAIDQRTDISRENHGGQYRLEKLVFTIRQRQDMALVERLMFEGRLFEVLAVVETPTDSLYLQITAEEVSL